MGDTLYGLRLTLSKRLVLATAAVAAFVVPLAAGAINRATLSWYEMSHLRRRELLGARTVDLQQTA